MRAKVEQRAESLGFFVVRRCAAESRSPSERWLEALVASVRPSPGVEFTRAFNGCWVAGFGEHESKAQIGLVWLEHAALSAPEFSDICSRCGVREQDAAHEIVPAISRRRPSYEDASRVLLWTLKDLRELADSERSLGGAVGALEQSYEMIDLLHEFGQSVTRTTSPDVLIKAALEELRSSLGYGWVAASFNPKKLHDHGLDRAVFLSAREGLDEAEIRRAISLVPLPEDFCTGWVRSFQDLSPVFGEWTVIEPVLVGGLPVGILMSGQKDADKGLVSTFDSRLVEGAASQIGPILHINKLFEAQRRLFIGVVRALTSSIDAKDQYTRGHSERVAHLGALLATRLSWSQAQVERVHLTGLLHDVGKIGVPERVLGKPGRLTDEEFGEIKKHPETGHRILGGIPGLDDVLPGVLHHHERWDGRGYPHGLTGQDIPMVARILALADTFDAMSSSRAYREGMPRAKVLAEIRKCAGAQFDPDLAPIFVELDFTEYDVLVKDAARQAVYEQPAAPRSRSDEAA